MITTYYLFSKYFIAKHKCKKFTYCNKCYERLITQVLIITELFIN